MRKEIINWRIWALGILSMISLICIVSEPAENEAWWSAFIISKGIGFATAYLVYRLASYWEKRNLIPELDEDEEV